MTMSLTDNDFQITQISVQHEILSIYNICQNSKVIAKLLPVIGTKFRLGGNHEIITEESVLTVIFNNSGEAGAENKTRKEEIRILKIRAAP